ncbi:MAG: hypothetical protein B5766_00805 [Candidatus Lumbricidophila eiseniae]|uniref:Glycosyl hydrolase family 88 n=1 Tax=Candidatus Lumbricidiphila eiseniae TaxID=1969409 RepID=A0A2A6FUX7_9MICO|nr:MAG: hypothetical protein B5766_00805 [Candidatus Lumbricidophila eiseniae]
MTGLDTSSAELASPPTQPLGERDITRVALSRMAGRVIDRTVELGFTRWFWGEGVCAQAMLRATDALGSPPPQVIFDYFDSFAACPPIIEHVNNLVSGASACVMYQRTGDDSYRSLADRCLHWYEGSPGATRDGAGTLEHWPGGVWADTVYMAGSFLLQYGRLFNRPDLIEQAIDQWLLHASALSIDDSGLIVHGTHRGEALPAFWGRANAWFAMAGVDLLRFTPSGISAQKTVWIRERLNAQLLALIRIQPEHGVWDVLVDSQPESTGILESSAAAGIGAAMLRFSRLTGDDQFYCAGKRSTLGALAYLKDGWLTRVSAGTVLQLVPFGYSVIRDDRAQSWGQGLALEAIAALLE